MRSLSLPVTRLASSYSVFLLSSLGLEGFAAAAGFALPLLNFGFVVGFLPMSKTMTSPSCCLGASSTVFYSSMHSGTPTNSKTTPPWLSVTAPEALRVPCLFEPLLIFAKNSLRYLSFSCFCSRKICSSYYFLFSFSCCIFRFLSFWRYSSYRCFSTFCFIIIARFCLSSSICWRRACSYSYFYRFFSSLKCLSAML